MGYLLGLVVFVMLVFEGLSHLLEDMHKPHR